MGTRADFYIKQAGQPAIEWVASIAWDGYPSGISCGVKKATTIQQYKDELQQFFEQRDDVTTPALGWPWPWSTSATTDYAYLFDQVRGKVVVHYQDDKWIDASLYDDEDFDPYEPGYVVTEVVAYSLPEYSTASATYGRRSGLLVISR